MSRTVLSGIRATGRLHLGNYLGVLTRFAEMSKNPEFSCFFFVADLHTLTTLKEAELIKEHMPNIVLDFLAAGVDPEKAAIYLQSDVPQVTELAWYLACLAPAGDLERMPTFKDKKLKQPEDINSGLLFYPVLMAADILAPRAHLVPVGRDQQPHLEFAVEIARRFNRIYGDFFPIPGGLNEEMVLIPGLSAMDDRNGFPKMGKSDANTVNLTDSEEETWQKIRVAPTDPKRIRRLDKGNPQHCAIYQLHAQVSDPKVISWVVNGCNRAEIGCVDCKKALADRINGILWDFRENRAALEKRHNIVSDVLERGRVKVEPVIKETIGVVRERMGIQRR